MCLLHCCACEHATRGWHVYIHCSPVSCPADMPGWPETWTLTCMMASARRSRSTGLDKKPSMPAFRHSSRSRSLALAVMATMGTVAPRLRKACTYALQIHLPSQPCWSGSAADLGLDRKPSRPALRRSSRSRSLALAVMATMGTVAPRLRKACTYALQIHLPSQPCWSGSAADLGLDRKPSRPAPRRSSRSRPLALAVMATMGTVAPRLRKASMHTDHGFVDMWL